MHQQWNQAAALYLSVSLRKMFPHIQYLCSTVEEGGFSAYFRDTEKFQESFLPMLEKKMGEVAEEELLCREMLAANAAELFLHKQESGLAEVLKGAKGTVQVVQIGSYYDLSKYTFSPTRHFSLLGYEQRGAEVRIFGIAFPSSKERKNFLKLHKNYDQNNHQKIAQQLELYEQNFWHPKGMKLLYILKDRWRKFLQEHGFEEVGTQESKKYFSFSGRKQFCFWEGGEDHIFSFCQQSPISFLQMMEKWIKIYDFEMQWVLPSFSRKLAAALEECKLRYVKGEESTSFFPRVELHIADGLGRFWPGPVLEWQKETIAFSLFGDLARFVALLLEKRGGNLPFWLCPEQARVILIGERREEPLIRILEECQIRYVVDREECSLKEKMYRALRAKVPCVMVFGINEEKQGTVKMRVYDSHNEKAMTLDQLNHFFAERTLESQ